MSESSYPFNDTVEETVVARDNRKILAAIAGVAALALLAIFVLIPALTGGDDEDAAPVVRRRPGAAAPVASPTPRRPTPVTATFNDTVGRDPFRPLYVAPAQGLVGPGAPVVPGGPIAGPGTGGTTDPGTGGAAPGTGGTTDPGTGGGTTDPGTGGGGGTGSGSGSSASVGGNRVALIDVFVRDGATYAQTKVGSTVYTPRVGSTFAANYQLLTASGECATFLYGDEQFRLCEGQEVLK